MMTDTLSCEHGRVYVCACVVENLRVFEKAKKDADLRVSLLEDVLRTIGEWDMINPPQAGDYAWLRKLVDDALAVPSPREESK